MVLLRWLITREALLFSHKLTYNLACFWNQCSGTPLDTRKTAGLRHACISFTFFEPKMLFIFYTIDSCRLRNRLEIFFTLQQMWYFLIQIVQGVFGRWDRRLYNICSIRYEVFYSTVMLIHKRHKLGASYKPTVSHNYKHWNEVVLQQLLSVEINRGSDCSVSAGSRKAPVDRSKHNGGRDFRQHAYSQRHNMLSLPLLPLPEQERYYTGPHEGCCTLRITRNKKPK